MQVAHPRHRAGACTLNAVGLLPVSGRGDARVAPPCPTTLCVWRRLPYLTLPLLLWHASRLRLAGASARQLGSA